MSVRRPWSAIVAAVAMVMAGASGALAKDVRDRSKPAPVQAAASVEVSCDFIEIAASSGKEASIDPELKSLEKRLKRLKQWNTFKQLSKSTKTLAKKKPERLTLKNFAATATLIEIVDKTQIRVSLELDDGKGKVLARQTQLVSAADWVITAYVQTSGDGFLLAASCK